MDIINFFFTESVVKHWNRPPREMVESPTLELFRGYEDGSFSDMVQW